MIASRSIETGDAEIIIAGGAESMTRAPWVLMKPDRPFPASDHHGGLHGPRLAVDQQAHAGRVDGVAR